jgi:rod shape-determining protein MreD
MIIVYYLLGSVVVVLLQTTFSELLSIHGIKPDVVVIYLVYIALAEKRSTATLAGFLLGLVEDIISTGLYGISALTKSIAAFVAGSFRGQRDFKDFYGPCIVIAAASFTQNILGYSILSLGSPLGFWQAIFILAVPSTIYTTVIGLIGCAIMPRTWWQRIKLSSNE